MISEAISQNRSNKIRFVYLLRAFNQFQKYARQLGSASHWQEWIMMHQEACLILLNPQCCWLYQVVFPLTKPPASQSYSCTCILVIILVYQQYSFCVAKFHTLHGWMYSYSIHIVDHYYHVDLYYACLFLCSKIITVIIVSVYIYKYINIMFIIVNVIVLFKQLINHIVVAEPYQILALTNNYQYHDSCLLLSCSKHF